MKKVCAQALSSSTDLIVGRIGRAHGIKGEVSVRLLVDEPGHFDPGSRLSAGQRDFVVMHSRPHKNTLLVGFEGVVTRNDAEALRDVELSARSAERRGLETDEFWPEDLIGLQVYSGDAHVGAISDVVTGDAQDRLVVTTSDDRIVEIPFVDELVPEVLLDEGLIRVSPIDGLI